MSDELIRDVKAMLETYPDRRMEIGFSEWEDQAAAWLRALVERVEKAEAEVKYWKEIPRNAFREKEEQCMVEAVGEHLDVVRRTADGYLQETIRLRAERDALKAEAERLRAVIREVEFEGMDKDVRYGPCHYRRCCPSCKSFGVEERGHDDHCPIAAALQPPDATGGGR